MFLFIQRNSVTERFFQGYGDLDYRYFSPLTKRRKEIYIYTLPYGTENAMPSGIHAELPLTTSFLLSFCPPFSVASRPGMKAAKRVCFILGLGSPSVVLITHCDLKPHQTRNARFLIPASERESFNGQNAVTFIKAFNVSRREAGLVIKTPRPREYRTNLQL